MLYVWCSLFCPVISFSQIPSMTEYFKWKPDPTLASGSDIVLLEPFTVLDKKTESISPKILRDLDEVLNGTHAAVQEEPSSKIGLALLPERPEMDSVVENLLPRDVWIKLHGGNKVGDATAYIHSGVSWKLSGQTEFIFPFFQGGIHGTGFSLKRRF